MDAKSMARRDRLAATAAQLFAERGYGATSMAQIATAAGASKETLYSYFGSKAALLRYALTMLINPFSSGSSDLTAPFPTELERMAKRLVEQLMQPNYLALARIVISEIPRDPSLGEVFRTSIADPAFVAVTELIRAGSSQGAVRPDVDPDSAARSLIGPLLTYVLLDGLLRAPAEIRVPGDPAIAGVIEIFQHAITNQATQEGKK